jgi:spermidine/putrescine transport system substrate-binding protein
MGYGTNGRNMLGRRSLLQGLGVAAIGISFGGLAGCSKSDSGAKTGGTGEEPALNFYNWDTYIGETTLADFKASSGIDVKMDLFDSNDVLFAKFKAGNPGYDVIVPSNDFVERMAEAGMLMELDHAQIPNRQLEGAAGQRRIFAADRGAVRSRRYVPPLWQISGQVGQRADHR